MFKTIFNQLLFLCLSNKQKRKKSIVNPFSLSKFQKSTFWIFLLKTGYPSFIQEKNIKRVDSGDPAACNYRGKTLRVAIRAFLFRASPEIHVVGRKRDASGLAEKEKDTWWTEKSWKLGGIGLLKSLARASQFCSWHSAEILECEHVRFRLALARPTSALREFLLVNPGSPRDRGLHTFFGLLKFDDSFFLSDSFFCIFFF